MCEPISAAIAIASVVGATANVAAQAKSAKAQQKAIEHQQAIAREQTRATAGAELFDQMRATRREQARIRAAAGEAGLSLSSNSIEGLLMDSEQQGQMQGARTLANMESRHAAHTAEAVSMLSHIHKPTALGAGLQIGSAALQGWSGMKNAQLKKTRTKQAATG